MVSTEEQELIDLRIKWADMPILNFWHNTNDAPDTFFDELLDASRGDETSETKSKRTTTRSKGSGEGDKGNQFLHRWLSVKVLKSSYKSQPRKVGESFGNMWTRKVLTKLGRRYVQVQFPKPVRLESLVWNAKTW